MRGIPIAQTLKQNESIESYPNQDFNVGEIPANAAFTDETRIPTQGLLAIPFGIIALAWIVFFMKRSLTWKVTRYPNVQYRNQKIPCSQCRFFGRNSYLQCAVHPAKVSKKEAIGCSDYWAQDSDKFSQ
jgi:hypothetical protein